MSSSDQRYILLNVFVLILIGLIAVYSSTSIEFPEGKTNQFYYFKKQLLILTFGIIVMFIAYKLKLEFFRRMALLFIFISLVVLLLVFTNLGVTVKGATRWIKVAFFSFQPSELVKLSMIVFLAWYMSRESFKKDSFLSFIIPICVMAVYQFIFLMQPDFGATISLAVLTITMLFLGGVPLRYIGGLSVFAVALFAILLFAKPYRVKRLLAFLDPWNDPLGSGFQLIQSYIALGSGGLTGVGLGEARQKLAFLPEIHTDFIFSLIGEEGGFLAVLVVVLLFFHLFYRGVKIALKTTEPFAYFIVCGTTLMITLQALINFLVTTGLAPTKGLPLPFISYGGSALIVNMAAVGLLLNVAKNQEGFVNQMVDNSGSYEIKKFKRVKNLGGTRQWQRAFGYRFCSALRYKRDSL
ncbi:MAG: putative lipid II flippase FtsW [Thermodesulfovibrionales bacterium]|nr:putative lipid II flippase FtsW [Thermodesulfovibrionales bacterium]